MLFRSAWTEELHGELSTATCSAELRGTERKMGREREVAARGRSGEVGLGFAAPWGSCSAREQVGRGPATVVVRRACLCLSARTTVTRTGVGPGCSEREREGRGWAGWAAARCAPRGGRRLGRPVWVAWLPPALVFFFETFYFSFLVFLELEKERF